MLKIWKSDSSADIVKKKTTSVLSRLQRLVRYLLLGCPDINMFYENGKPKKEKSGTSIDISEVEKLIKSSNADLLSSLVKQLKTTSFNQLIPEGTEDFSKETISQLAKMMGEKREDSVQDLGRKIEIKSDTEKDQKTVDLLRSLD